MIQTRIGKRLEKIAEGQWKAIGLSLPFWGCSIGHSKHFNALINDIAVERHRESGTLLCGC